MNIINFTPLSAFAGGIIIGLAVVIFFISNGRLAGISSITDNILTSKQGRGDNFLFLIGLVVGPIIFLFSTTNEIPFFITNSLPLIIIALLLMTNVESSFDLKSKEQYSAVKKTVQVVRLISGIK